MPLTVEGPAPYADGRFPTRSGKVELYSEAMAAMGLDPLPGGAWAADDDGGPFSSPLAPRGRGVGGEGADSLLLISAGSHHFVSSSLASQPGLLRGAGEPVVEIHPADAAARGVTAGDVVIVENGRGAVRLKAVVTDRVRPGVVASPKGRWAKLSGGRNVNWTTSDALGDLAGQSTFQSNRVWVRKAASEGI